MKKQYWIWILLILLIIVSIISSVLYLYLTKFSPQSIVSGAGGGVPAIPL